MGPGLLAALSGNDAGGIATYSSAGASYGYCLLYTSCAGTISILFTFVAMAFGWACRKFNLTGAKQFATGVVLMVAMFAVGMQFPVYLDLNGWIAVVMVYLVFAGAMPIQTLKQPREDVYKRQKFHRIVGAGFHVKIPFIDRKAATVSLRTMKNGFDIDVKTQDNVRCV